MPALSARFRKICVIVDNPLRDLDGMVLLAWHMATPDCAVYIVPMYHSYEIFLIRPDFVLINYIRGVNEKQVALYAELGIAVGVLDTEGGVLTEENVDDMHRDLLRNMHNIPLYCAWGEGLIKGMRKRGFPADYNMVATGCPRYDYCSPEWSEALPGVWESDRPMVLVNSSLSFAFPRYQSIEKEIHEAITVQKLSPEWVRQRVAETRYTFEELSRTVAYLAPRFPGIAFVVRPHPFEDNTLFQPLTERFPNVEIHQKGTVFPWIRASLAMVHHYSTTSVDCIFMGREPIMLDWIKAPTIHVQIATDVSVLAPSLEELALTLERLSKGERLEVDAETLRRRENLVRDWFYANDGKSSERVSRAVFKVLEGRGSLKGNLIYFNILCWKLLKSGDLKGALKRALLLILGSEILKKLKTMRRKETKKSGKEFTTADVKAIVERIEAAKGRANPVQVASANEPFSHPTSKTHFSIRISR